jgi:hypothetical protein
MPLCGQKFLVSAFFYKSAVMQNDYSVTVLNGGKAVGDDKAGSIAGKPQYRALNDRFSFRID